MKIFHDAVELSIKDEQLDGDVIRRNWELYGKTIDDDFCAIHEKAVRNSTTPNS